MGTQVYKSQKIWLKVCENDGPFSPEKGEATGMCTSIPGNSLYLGQFSLIQASIKRQMPFSVLANALRLPQKSMTSFKAYPGKYSPDLPVRPEHTGTQTGAVHPDRSPPCRISCQTIMEEPGACQFESYPATVQSGCQLAETERRLSAPDPANLRTQPDRRM